MSVACVVNTIVPGHLSFLSCGIGVPPAIHSWKCAMIFFGPVDCCDRNQSRMRVASPKATVSLMSVSASPNSIW